VAGLARDSRDAQGSRVTPGVCFAAVRRATPRVERLGRLQQARRALRVKTRRPPFRVAIRLLLRGVRLKHTGGRPGSSCRLYRPWSDAVRSGANVRVSPLESASHFRATAQKRHARAAPVGKSRVSDMGPAFGDLRPRKILQSAYPVLRNSKTEKGPDRGRARDGCSSSRSAPA
jgi:hypothetical protein